MNIIEQAKSIRSSSLIKDIEKFVTNIEVDESDLEKDEASEGGGEFSYSYPVLTEDAEVEKLNRQKDKAVDMIKSNGAVSHIPYYYAIWEEDGKPDDTEALDEEAIKLIENL
jgi:hypothetical protein